MPVIFGPPTWTDRATLARGIRRTLDVMIARLYAYEAELLAEKAKVARMIQVLSGADEEIENS